MFHVKRWLHQFAIRYSIALSQVFEYFVEQIARVFKRNIVGLVVSNGVAAKRFFEFCKAGPAVRRIISGSDAVEIHNLLALGFGIKNNFSEQGGCSTQVTIGK